MDIVRRDNHTGSGNAQVSSTRDADCTLRVGSTSSATGVTCGDDVPEVEAGVMATRDNTGSYVCPHCGRFFRRDAALRSHLPHCPHRPDVKSSCLSCSFCQRFFNRPCEVAKHEVSCSSRPASTADNEQVNKELACPHCDRRFKRPCEIGRHLQSCKRSRSSEHPDDRSEAPCPSRLVTHIGTESRLQSTHQACQTPEPAPSATSPLHQHSAGGPEALQFAPTLGQDQTASFDVQVKKPISIPSSGCKGYWTNANAALEAVIEQSCPGLRSMPPEQALHRLCTLTYNFFDSHPVPPRHRGTTKKPTSKPTALRTLRKKLRDLRREWRQRSSEPAAQTASLRHDFHQTRKQIKQITRQHSEMTGARRQAKEHAEFRKDPYKYGRKVLNTKSTAAPTFSLEEAEQYFSKQFADSDRGHCYERYKDLPDPPQKVFNVPTAPPTFSDFQKVLRSRRNGAAPGPNGIPNTVWKRCSCLHTPLFNIIRQVWKACSVPQAWQCAAIRLFHKSGPTDNPANFRPIALSNCEGKIFFALLGKAILEHMLKNSFFDQKVQKGFLPGVAGCLEHSALLADAIHDARSHQRAICISWLDLRNAFGSVRHSLILFVLRHFGFPDHFIRLIHSYYGHLSVMVDIPNLFSTRSFHFALGVFQGCTLSPILFNIVIQLGLDVLEQHQSFAYTFSSDRETSLLSSAYADDVQLVTSFPEQNQRLLDTFSAFLLWTRTMEARASKCWSVALKKFADGYRRFNPHLTISAELLQYLDDGDFRYLGRPTNVHGSESRSRKAIESNLRAWLDCVDGLCLPATAKLWLYQHLIVAKLSWSFTSLDLSLSFAKHLEAMAVAYLKRWSGLPHPANVAILHTGSSRRAGLRITHLATFWKQMQAVRLDILHQSADSRCSRLYDRLLLRQGQWSRRYAPAVEHACALTVVNANSPPADNSRVSQLPRRKRILNLIASIDTEEQLSKLQQLSVQGRWLEWTDVMNSDLSWRRLLHGLDDSELSFSLRVVTNTLPTPDNLRRWGQSTTDSSCPLCGRNATLRHVLNGCSVALRQGRYTWRHDNVLRILKRHFLKFWESVLRELTNSSKDVPYIHLVPEGAPRLPDRQRQRRPLLSNDALRCANDWQFLFDVDGGYNVFPIEIAASAQRPDIVIFSLSLRKVLLIELTVPLEDRVATAHSIKISRYQNLISACESNGFRTVYFAVEVGSRGFVARSLLACLRQLGFPPSWTRKVRNECSRVALRSSYILYLRRAIDLWRNITTLA